MTALTDTDPADAFLAALPQQLRRYWRETDDVAGWVNLATSRGWSIRDLAVECSRGLGRTFNASLVVKSRLHRFAQQGPPQTHMATFVQPKPHCGHPGCDPETRWFTDLETGKLVGRCPDCWTDPA